MRSLGCLLVVFCLSAAPAAGREIYVDNVAGDDGFTGHKSQNTSGRAGPVRTIARALQLAGGGDRIVLANREVPYRESISLVGSRHSGYPQRPFSIEGNGAILDGSAPVEPDAWTHDHGAVFRFRPPRTGHQQLFLDDRPAVRAAVGRMAEAPPQLEPLEWCLYRGQILFCVEPGKLPGDYRLTYAQQQTGITLFHVRRVDVVNLTVQGFRLDGINAYNSAREVYLAGVTCRGNGRSGIAVGGASRVEIDACLLGNNGRAQLLTLALSETFIRNSDLFSNTAPAWVDRGGRVTLDGQPIQGGIDRQDVRATEDNR